MVRALAVLDAPVPALAATAGAAAAVDSSSAAAMADAVVAIRLSMMTFPSIYNWIT